MNKKYSGLDVRSLQAEDANTPNNPATPTPLQKVSLWVLFVDSGQSEYEIRAR